MLLKGYFSCIYMVLLLYLLGIYVVLFGSYLPDTYWVFMLYPLGSYMGIYWVFTKGKY